MCAARPPAPRARIEKSRSRSAASRLDSVCSGSTTRWRTANEQPSQMPTIDHRERPLDFRGVVAGPEQKQRDQRGRQAGGQSQEEDALVESETSAI